MKIMRTAMVAGIGKKIYDEARKPHNQEKIRQMVDKAKGRRGNKPPH